MSKVTRQNGSAPSRAGRARAIRSSVTVAQFSVPDGCRPTALGQWDGSVVPGSAAVAN